MTDAAFEIVDHTADTAIRGHAGDLPALFRVMAEGLFTVITDPERVDQSVDRTVTLETDSLEELMQEWLQELNNLHQIHGELYSGFTVAVSGGRLTATVHGEAIDPDRHDLRVEVKGITWHDLVCRKIENGYEAFVLVDI